MGKPHSGLMNGHLIWLGSFDECVAIKAVVNNSNELSYPYKGQYCTATFGKEQVCFLQISFYLLLCFKGTDYSC